MNTHDKIELPSSDEAAAHMLPSDLKKFESGEHVAEAFSIAVGNPDETSQPLFTLDQVRAAIEADRKRGGESSSLAEVWRINADEAEAYGQPDRADTLRECAAEVERLAAPQPAQRALITGKQLPDGSYEAVPAESVETLKVPSIDEIMDAVWAYGCAHGMRKVTATELVTRWRDIRALLARYGRQATPQEPLSSD